MIPEEYIVPYLISNLVAVALVATAIAWPRVTRWLFVLIFLAASLFNTFSVLTEPEGYWEYGDMAVLEVYREFIAGFFTQHTKAVVLPIALGQLCVAALLSHDGLRRLGVFGGCLFLLAIIPLGVGAAFPCALLMAAALVLMECRLSDASLPAPEGRASPDRS